MRFRHLLFFIVAMLQAACSSYSSGSLRNEDHSPSLKGNFTISQQVAPPDDIQSVQLYPSGRANAPPIFKLNGSSPLTLEFDLLGSTTRSFRLSVSHREKDWRESPLPVDDYIKGFSEVHFNNNRSSLTNDPGYFHYSYQFPNQRMKLTKSGNYLLSVYDDHSNKLLFQMPFFVTKNVGKLQTRLESLYAQRPDGRDLAQPFSVYRYPNFVRQPQFELAFAYVQNRFWGRARSTDFFDTASPGEIHFHLGRDTSFIKNYEINVLDLRSFRPDGRQIIDYQPGKIPPTVKLRRDVQQFNTTLNRYPGPIRGPRNGRQAEYGNVIFSLETSKNTVPTDEIYIVGDFNNWTMNASNRMQYDSTVGLWKGNALIKQGTYAYKYVQIEQHEVNDLALDRGFTSARQEYLTFIYYDDPERHFDRLLNVDVTNY